MCRPKPGNRCSPCSTTTLRSAQRRHAAAVTAYDQLQQAGAFDTAPSKERKARDRVAKTEERLVKATLNYDATRPGLKQLRDQIEAGKATSRGRSGPGEVDALERRMAAATRLRQERRDLTAQRPADPPSTTQASKTRAQLGSAYDDLAMARARLELHDTPPESAINAVSEAEQRAFQADVRHRFAQAKGEPDPAHLSADEVKTFRRASDQGRRRLATLSHLRAAAAQDHHGLSLRAETERTSDRIRAEVGLSPTQARDTSDGDPLQRTPQTRTEARPPERKKSWLKRPPRSRRRDKDGIPGKAADFLDEQLDAQPGRQQGKGLAG